VASPFYAIGRGGDTTTAATDVGQGFSPAPRRVSVRPALPPRAGAEGWRLLVPSTTEERAEAAEGRATRGLAKPAGASADPTHENAAQCRCRSRAGGPRALLAGLRPARVAAVRRLCGPRVHSLRWRTWNGTALTISAGLKPCPTVSRGRTHGVLGTRRRGPRTRERGPGTYGLEPLPDGTRGGERDGSLTLANVRWPRAPPPRIPESNASRGPPTPGGTCSH
jgi:hypothetical protein